VCVCVCVCVCLHVCVSVCACICNVNNSGIDSGNRCVCVCEEGGAEAKPGLRQEKDVETLRQDAIAKLGGWCCMKITA
jgi:hypothetical protein